MRYEIKNNYSDNVKELPLQERPREKMKYYGVKSLSDAELLCVLIRMGSKGHNVKELASKVLDIIDEKKEIDLSCLQNVEGLGCVASTSVCAALEFGRRFSSAIKRGIKNSSDVFNELRHYGDREQEHFICVLLNGALEIISTEVITVGLANKTLVHPREVFKKAIRKSSSAVIIAHNHPSGVLEPSTEDLQLTERIQKAGAILGIEVLDHLIFSSVDYYSMRENGNI